MTNTYVNIAKQFNLKNKKGLIKIKHLCSFVIKMSFANVSN